MLKKLSTSAASKHPDANSGNAPLPSGNADSLRTVHAAEATDEDLLTASRAGDQQAFKHLVERYESKIATTITAMLGHTTEAEDVGQETFIRFYNALHKFRGDSSIPTYLNRIAINLSLNALKRRKRFFSRFQDTHEQDLAEIQSHTPEYGTTEQVQLIRGGILKLAPEFRAVIVLRLIEGYSTKETAEMLNLPLGTVLSRLSRAQNKLRDILRPYISDENR